MSSNGGSEALISSSDDVLSEQPSIPPDYAAAFARLGELLPRVRSALPDQNSRLEEVLPRLQEGLLIFGELEAEYASMSAYHGVILGSPENFQGVEQDFNEDVDFAAEVAFQDSVEDESLPREPQKPIIKQEKLAWQAEPRSRESFNGREEETHHDSTNLSQTSSLVSTDMTEEQRKLPVLNAQQFNLTYRRNPSSSSHRSHEEDDALSSSDRAPPKLACEYTAHGDLAKYVDRIEAFLAKVLCQNPLLF